MPVVKTLTCSIKQNREISDITKVKVYSDQYLPVYHAKCVALPDRTVTGWLFKRVTVMFSITADTEVCAEHAINIVFRYAKSHGMKPKFN